MTWEVPTEQEEPGFNMPDVQSFVEETLKLSSRRMIFMQGWPYELVHDSTCSMKNPAKLWHHRMSRSTFGRLG